MGTFIIADDQSETRDKLVAGFRRAGHDATGVSNGWQLLDSLGDDPTGFDVIVTDTRTEFPDGLTVVTLARAAGVRTPVVLCTSFSNERARKVAQGLGDILVLEPPAPVERVVEAAVRLSLREPGPESRWVGAASSFDDGEHT